MFTRLMACGLLIALLVACGGSPQTTAPTSAPAASGAASSVATQPTDAPAPTTAPEPTDVPKPTEAPTATPEPTPEPVEQGTSRSNPLPIGTGLQFETWAVTITEVLRGDEAVGLIREANQFNDPPREGYTYVMATLQLENISTKQEAQHTSFAIDLRVTGDRNILYSPVSVVPPKQFEGELFPGGTAEGQRVFAVPSDEKNLMFFVGESLSFDEESRRFVALDEGASIAPSADLAATKENNLGTARNAPAKLGDTVVSPSWEVKIVEVVRGDEAVELVKQANQFNDPAPPDMEYVAVRVHVRYIGTDDPDEAQHASGSDLKITGEKNKVYDSPSAVAPDPQLDAYLFPGGETEGWEVLSVAKGEQKLAVIFEPLFSFSNDDTRFLALE